MVISRLDKPLAVGLVLLVAGQVLNHILIVHYWSLRHTKGLLLITYAKKCLSTFP